MARNSPALVLALLLLAVSVEGQGIMNPIVEVEEEVYRYVAPDNGSGPMWTHGNTCIVRIGEEVWASGQETLPDRKPLNNTRWLLFHRPDDGQWRQVADGGDTAEREPCPLVCFPDGRVFLSTNPNDAAPDQHDGTATPQVVQLRADDPVATLEVFTPPWNREIRFHGHTYRSFVADGPNRELALIYNIAYDKFYWTFRDRDGRWAAQGEAEFPWGAEYDKPQPIRICYPAVELRDRALHFLGVSDIVEPYDAWRAFKKELTGRDWDYDFRRLFYTWTDDLAAGEFHPWVEVASRDKTAGHIFPMDMHVSADGSVHALWTERALDTRLRERFFPEEKQSWALSYALLRDGEVVVRQSVVALEEGEQGPRPGNGRFHVTPSGRLFVFYHQSGQDAAGRDVGGNWLREVIAEGSFSAPVKVPLQHPFGSFFTATSRGGSAPSEVLDIFGEQGGAMRYARVRLWAE